MTERKVINKYYPPDFDPSKIPKLRLQKNRQFVIRIMAPFNMRCKTCGEYIYKGKKFNARKEDAEGELYLGIQVYRFYIKCTRCLAEITFKTDPENQDYAMEHGAVRNFECVRLAEKQAQEEAKAKEEEAANNPMKVLENRTKDSRREMAILEALEEIKEINARHNTVEQEDAMRKHFELEKEMQRIQEEQDELEIKNMFKKRGTVKRALDSDSDDDADHLPPLAETITRVGRPTDLIAESSLGHGPAGPAVTTAKPEAAKKIKVLEKKAAFGKATFKDLIKPKSQAPPVSASSAAAVAVAAAAPSKPAYGLGLGLVGSYSDSDSD